jgi:DUF4097 and DUF4098 domain-containing protein YvlB
VTFLTEKNIWGLGYLNDVPATSSQCSSSPISYKTGEMKYTFDIEAAGNSNSFYFSQQWSKKPTGPSPSQFIQTAGGVIIQDAGVNALHPITVDLEVKLSHEELENVINIKQDEGGLVFESETYLDTFTGTNPCISVIATISIASTSNISFFEIDTVLLPIQLTESLRLNSNNIYLHSISGPITSRSKSLDGRKVEVETTSSNISGSYPLADLLSIKTVSGTVDVDITPKEAGTDTQLPGNLLIRTGSGDIKTATLVSSLPNRNFTSQIKTVSGSISGDYLLGTNTNLNGASGSVKANLYTVGDSGNRSLIVNSISGDVSSTIFDDEFALGTVRSSFETKSGKISAQFPRSWEGHIQGKSTTGSIDVTGDGVKIIKDTSVIGGFSRTVIAERGEGDSNISAGSISGSIQLRL